jgi:hypothetical protein
LGGRRRRRDQVAIQHQPARQGLADRPPGPPRDRVGAMERLGQDRGPSRRLSAVSARLRSERVWRGRISGQAADLERLRHASVATGAVEVIEDAEDGVQIHVPELNALPDAATAHESYETLLRQINGLLRVQFGFYYSGVSLDYVVEVAPDGSRRRTIVTDSNAVGPILAAEDPPPEPPVLGGLARVRTNADLAEAVERYAEAKDWPDLYDVFEIVRESLGGGAAARRTINAWVGGERTRSRFTQTANVYRHARPDVRPANPMTFVEGDDFIRTVLRRAAT